MNGLSVLLLGVGLGLRHATDADHVVVVSALLQREPGVVRAARVAALWGLGHSAAFLGLGLAVVLLDVVIPAAFERLADVSVGLMLVSFGLWHLRTGTSQREHRHHLHHHPHDSLAEPAKTSAWRPIAIGLVHGLAGSAGIALLAATTIGSPRLAVAYLLLFGLGTVLGMVALTVALSRPMVWTMERGERARRVMTVGASLASIGFGVLVLAKT
jgi:sulfite exporter TauE/SafE